MPKKYADTTPSADFILWFLKRSYPLSGPLSCRLLSKRRGSLYQIQAGKRKFLFKLLALFESKPSEAAAQVEVIDAVGARGVSLQRVIRSRKGAGFVQLPVHEGKRVGIMFGWEEGVTSPKKWTPKLRQGYGRLVAEFQLAAASLPQSPALQNLDFAYMAGDTLKLMRPWLKGKPELLARFKKSASWIQSELKLLPRDSSFWGLVHGDTHGGNFILNQGRFKLIDTEQIALGWRAYDVATYFWGQAYGYAWGGKPDQKFWDEKIKPFLQGYESRRPLTQAERRALPAIMLARDFWLTRMYTHCTELFGAFTFGENNDYFSRSIRLHELIRRNRAFFRRPADQK
jgi:Ser/Thr protein kinase RdoA (MazF antagonist)